ncbi:X-prolyl aminopeptidase (Aminopeptidase P) [Nesidiocoris tenuis]|uniref:X-prolyl aminopeptidase (Aminopeptidase P) n=1 Tax=Nesidiocoris tenuis TaxID=355587 RepID=A0ABN7AIV2_9HEMI|nr:X-prolyl aminopeptidase (Aminopeptidase P) [Nesidiocoris tenuis]
MWILMALFVTSAISGAPQGKVTKTLENRLVQLRKLMKDHDIQAYIIPSSDDHQTEFVPKPDQRREFISGFSGSMGDALVTTAAALLWTDSRYHLQAANQLPPFWTLMHKENASSSMEEWLVKNLEGGQKAAVDPKKVTVTTYTKFHKKLNDSGIQLVALEDNLIDQVWTNRPKHAEGNVYVHPLEFAGETYESKMARVRQKMVERHADLFVVSKLDEIAWLLNLRGYEGEHTPTFVAYVTIGNSSASLYTNTSKIPPDVKAHLNKRGAEVKVNPYEDFIDDFEKQVNASTRVLVPESANYLIYSKVPKNKRLVQTSAIADMKALKNPVEVESSRNAHIRDAVALCKLQYQMEREINQSVQWDELKAAEVLAFYRSQQKYNMGSSFPSIVASGKNSALPHYTPTPETNLPIDKSAPVTLDTGGQYLDGTIDTTRVWHFGTPTDFQIKVYTALLQGVADLATTVFPGGSPSKVFDFVIRRPLLKLGLNFGHGTTHGTGLFLEVHEDYNGTFFENFIGSQEPGYYKKGDFGMRLENLVVVVPFTTDKQADGIQEDGLLTFSPLTLVPYESKLIEKDQMDKSQIDWVNQYHEKIRKIVGDEMIKQGLHSLYKWLMDKTNPI